MRLGLAALACPVVLGLSQSAPAQPASVILVNARIATQDSVRREATAMVLRGDRIAYVGNRRAALRWRVPHSRVIDVHGRRIIPGLIDAHIHPTAGLYDLDICDLRNRPLALAEIASQVQRCIARYRPAKGAWLNVGEWNYVEGNGASPGMATIRAALDQAAPDNPVQLVGSDFHHGGFNSRALALARGGSGAPVGLTRASLASEFRALAPFIGVDDSGEPDGRLSDNARQILSAPPVTAAVMDALLREPERTVRVLHAAGITTIQDAAVVPGESNRLYDLLQARGRLTIRVNLLPVVVDSDPQASEIPAAVARVSAFRAQYAGNSLIAVKAAKIFVDGTAEGNPRADPPALPSAPMLHPYLQPRFDLSGVLPRVTGYVDPAGGACAGWHPGGDRAVFAAAHGFAPEQCLLNHGSFVVGPPALAPLAVALRKAGFGVHYHAIGDAAVAAALDAVEAADAAAPARSSPDTIAHLQLVSDRDIRRIGTDRVFTAFTFAWATHSPGYDVTVIPFVQNVLVNGRQVLVQPDSYYDRHAFPARSILNAGGLVGAGSDAPVEQRNPRPFANMAAATTRKVPGQPALAPQERLSIGEALDAYTRINAKALGRDDQIGSLEPGKYADFAILDRDILALGRQGKSAAVTATRVVETWFAGKRVYRRAHDR